MNLLLPEYGLLIWSSFSFLILLFILSKYAWNPIMNTLKDREDKIQESLDQAKRAREEMDKLNADNQAIIREARLEREKIIKEAIVLKEKIVSEAKDLAKQESNRIIQQTKDYIEQEKKSAIYDIKREMVVLSLEIAENVIKKDLSSNEEQKRLINSLVENSKFN